MIPFDENGFMTDRPGFERSINQPGLQPPTDIFIMSHGWNNSPSEALASYRRMIELVNTVANIDGSRPEGYRPMLLGVRWPSKAWVDEAANEATISGLQPLESGPGSPAGRSIDPRIVAMLYENMPRGKVPDAEYSRDILELQDLIVLPEPTAADFRRAFAIYRRYAIEGEFPEDQSPFDNDEGMETALGRSVEDGRLRAPVAEGGLSIADTARVFTYWQMKGRAGLVGRNGLRLMIARLQTRFPEARIHLFGHSFGAKVLLAAVGERDMALPRPVETLVLLQGAVSLEALSDRVSGTNPRVPGGYRSALASSRVRGRIIVTFSRNDTPLNDFYPLASRLANQTGELEAAGVSRFAALGAVGAFGSAPGGGPLSDLEAMKRRGQPYERMLSRKVLSVDGGASPDFISGHSEIFNEHVAWLLWSAVKTTF
jgi:hypothetical protein